MITILNWKQGTEEHNLHDCQATILKYVKLCIMNDTRVADKALFHLVSKTDSNNYIDGKGLNKKDHELLRETLDYKLILNYELSDYQAKILKKAIIEYSVQLVDDVYQSMIKGLDSEKIPSISHFYYAVFKNDYDRRLINMLEHYDILNLVYQMQKTPEEFAKRILRLEKIVDELTKE